MVTYLLGAGASANAMPLVGNDFKKRFAFFGNELLRENSSDVSFNNLIQFYTKQINTHASPDTYAKKLHLQNNIPDYNQFKNLLSCYIIWEQIEKGYLQSKYNSEYLILDNEDKIFYENLFTTFDFRYDVLCAALLEKPVTLPENFSIISWNYDWQLERTLHQYDIDGATKNRMPFNQTQNGLFDSNKITKINGSAWFEYEAEDNGNKKTVYPFNDLFLDDPANLKLFYDIIIDKESKYKNYLKFAWESDIETGEVKKNFEVLKKTKSLVVIGYSFPYYNRKIDAALIRCLRLEPLKIYLQYLNEDDCKLTERKIRLLMSNAFGNESDKIPCKFIHIFKDDQFYIPDELIFEGRSGSGYAALY